MDVSHPAVLPELTVANQDSEFMSIFQRTNKKHLPAQTFPQVPITTPRMVGLHELASYKLGSLGPRGSMKYEFNHEKG